MKRLILLSVFFCTFVVFASIKESIRKGVRLEVVGISEQKIKLKIANESKKTIFLRFRPSINKQTEVSYNLFCESPKVDDNYVQYGGETILDLSLAPLNNQDYMLFDIDKDFKIVKDGELKCEAKVGYYENEKVAALINQKTSSEDKHLSEADSDQVKKEQIFESVKFVLK